MKKIALLQKTVKASYEGSMAKKEIASSLQVVKLVLLFTNQKLKFAFNGDHRCKVH